jgi:plasmid stability protein
MPAINIRGLDDSHHQQLRTRAAIKGHSMEAEIRAIIVQALDREEPSFLQNWLERAAHVRQQGGIDLELPPRDDQARVAAFE